MLIIIIQSLFLYYILLYYLFLYGFLLKIKHEKIKFSNYEIRIYINTSVI